MIRIQTIRIVTIVLLAGLALAFGGTAAAQQGGGGERRRGGAWARKHQVDKLTQKRFDKVALFYSERKWDDADRILDRLRIRSLNSEEKRWYYAWRGYLAAGRLDMKSARDNVIRASQETACTQEHLDMYYAQIAQFSLQLSEWDVAIDYFNRWFKVAKEPDSPVTHYLLALAYWQKNDYDAALVPAAKAVDLSTSPNEGWLQLLLAIHLTQKNYVKAIPIYDQLIQNFPKKTYWIQLATLHGALGNYEDSLVPLQLAFTQGYLTEDAEIRRLAELLLFLELPIRSVEVMQSGIDQGTGTLDSKYYELLSNGLIMSREYDQAVGPLTQAAELSEGGSIYLRLAEVHIQRERWEEASEALAKALKKGDLPSPGQAELLMGISYYSRKLPADALRWFNKALKFPETKAEATIWRGHIERELQADAEV